MSTLQSVNQASILPVAEVEVEDVQSCTRMSARGYCTDRGCLPHLIHVTLVLSCAYNAESESDRPVLLSLVELSVGGIGKEWGWRRLHAATHAPTSF